MEQLDYHKLIDPFCIPIIKYLREAKGIETMYCCQGRTKEDGPKEDHSLKGYIMAKYSPYAFTEFMRIFNSHISRYSSYGKGEAVIKIKRHPGPEHEIVIVVYLIRKTWKTKKELKNEWNLILSDLTKTLD